MYPDDSATALPRIGKETFIPALIGAIACVFLMRFGLLAFFFLAPLGVCAVVFGPVAAWLGFLFSLIGNGILAAGSSLHYGTGPASFGVNVLYFTVLSLGFTWMMAGNPAIAGLPPVRTVFRFIAAAVAGTLVFLAVIFTRGGDEVLSAIIRETAPQTFMEHRFTEDQLVGLFMAFILRGGALASAFFLFFFNRQTAFIIARFFGRYRRQQGGNTASDLMGFHVPRKTIGVFSVCLPVILLCRFISLHIVEIAAWNVLVICAILFLAQGGGIALWYLSRRPMSLIMRTVCIVLFLFVVFSPGLNLMAVVTLLLLGIAENWLPLRVAKNKPDWPTPRPPAA